MCTNHKLELNSGKSKWMVFTAHAGSPSIYLANGARFTLNTLVSVETIILT